jgi:predicted GIY-YIG superfamily endonuclease
MRLTAGSLRCKWLRRKYRRVKNAGAFLRRRTFSPEMRRRTFRQLRAASEAQFHHHVYVVLLDDAVAKERKVVAANPIRDKGKPCVYVGMTGLQPEERFWNHKNGEKAARWVRRYGVRLLPELFAHLNPMPFEAAAQMEKELAEDLRAQGYTVTGGT